MMYNWLWLEDKQDEAFIRDEHCILSSYNVKGMTFLWLCSYYADFWTNSPICLYLAVSFATTKPEPFTNIEIILEAWLEEWEGKLITHGPNGK